jgi:HlyD family secretion protein
MRRALIIMFFLLTGLLGVGFWNLRNGAQANLAKTKVTLEDTRRNLARAAELRKRDLVSQSGLDAAQTAFDAAAAQFEVAKARVEQAQAALNQAAVDLANTIIRSPVDGIVISRNVDVGQTVAASLQAPTLFIIANDLLGQRPLIDRVFPIPLA